MIFLYQNILNLYIFKCLGINLSFSLVWKTDADHNQYLYSWYIVKNILSLIIVSLNKVTLKIPAVLLKLGCRELLK